MKKRTALVPMLTAVATASLLFASQAQAQSVPASAAEGGRLWFVELAGAPVADGRTLATVRAEKAEFRRAATAAGVRFKERRQFDTLFNGFSIEVDAANRLKLQRMKGVKALYPVEIVSRPVVNASETAPDLGAALGLTGADVAQNSLGLTGRGIKVGIIDTGIDIDHPAFGGSGTPGTSAFPSARIVAGYDLVGDAYNAGGTGAALVPVPDANPDDCGGHGTHVAGIVGANGGGLKGVAPDVQFGAYRVFGCAGSLVVGRHRRGAGARLRRRHAGHQPEPGRGAPVAAVPDRPGHVAPGQQGRGDGRLDRQQRPRRQLARRARTPVRFLSGGERNRLLLAKLFAKPANAIVLDEPTNDLDAETLELLEERLVQFQGTILVVSHDREFLNNVVTTTIAFEADGSDTLSIEEYVGGYDDWVRQHEAKLATEAAAKKTESRTAKSNAASATTAHEAEA